jgi:hypothetical protein
MEKDHCNDSLKIVKTLILIENELALGLHPSDRMFFLEALLKEIKIEYCNSNNENMYKTAERIMCLLIKGRLITEKNDMQILGQKLRKYRKNFETCKFDYKESNNKIKSKIERGFNRKTKDKLHPLLEPLFNVLEVYKQLLLLLDHLSDKTLRCKTCILKHTLFIEGLTEEAIALDKKSKFLNEINELLKLVIKLRISYVIDKRHAYCKMVTYTKEMIEKCHKLLDNLDLSQKKYIFS